MCSSAKTFVYVSAYMTIVEVAIIAPNRRYFARP
ncbi:hypothetical protein BH24CHL9_BH24CHL9_06830 [soil metagenome]